MQLAPYRLGSNLRSRSRELATCALGAGRKCKREEAFRYGPVSNHQPFHRGFCLGASVSVCLFRSVCLSQSVYLGLSRSVSLCLGRAGHTDKHTHDVNSAVSRVAHASAMSKTSFSMAGITSIANIWSKTISICKTQHLPMLE